MISAAHLKTKKNDVVAFDSWRIFELMTYLPPTSVDVPNSCLILCLHLQLCEQEANESEVENKDEGKSGNETVKSAEVPESSEAAQNPDVKMPR